MCVCVFFHFNKNQMRSENVNKVDLNVKQQCNRQNRHLHYFCVLVFGIIFICLSLIFCSGDVDLMKIQKKSILAHDINCVSYLFLLLTDSKVLAMDQLNSGTCYMFFSSSSSSLLLLVCLLYRLFDA